MESEAKLFGRPIHQMLIVFPLGAMAVIFDVVSVMAENSRWTETAYYLIGAGVVTGLTAAVFGVIDYLVIPAGTRAKRLGLCTVFGNAIVVLLFAGSWMLRGRDPLNPETLAYWLSYVGTALSLITGWLGAELFDRLAFGVDSAIPDADVADEDANLDLPSSLSTRTIHRPQMRRA